MRKTIVLLLCLVVVLACAFVVYAENPIKIIVNGKEIHPDVPAQTINGRVLVPARFVAEALGATVSWDAATNSVIITSVSTPAITHPQSAAGGTSRASALPFGQSLVTPDGFQVSISSVSAGSAAWAMAKEANKFNDEPDPGHKYILLSVKVKNISSKDEPVYIGGSEFKLVGSSNKIFNTFDKSLVLPDSGPFKSLSGSIYRGGELSGGIHFQIPENEANLVLIWDKPWTESDKRFLKVD
jgi:hypothetical protein